MAVDRTAVTARAWEANLLNLARAALQETPDRRSPSADAKRLERAYAAAERVTAEHSRSFHLASQMLPADKRRAARALYAFCRATDDIVDSRSDDPAGELERWRALALADHPRTDNPVALAWADTRFRYGIPTRLAEQLISGIAWDLRRTRYATFDQLAEYAYGVASTVGLMSMHIIGFQDERAVPYALKMGVALQLTNILRDVAEDWAHGRLYLPQQELEAFGIGESDIAAGRVTPAWQDYARFFVQRNRRLYEEAWPGIGLLNADGRFAIGAASELYRGILQRIEMNGYDVFSRRAYLGKWEKVRQLPVIWWRTRNFG